MKKIVLGLAAVAALSLTVKPSAADPGGYAPPGAAGGAMPSMTEVAGPNTLLGAGQCPPWRGPDRYGLHPCLKKFFHVPTSAGGPGGGGNGPHNPLKDPANWAAGGYGMGGPAYNPNGFPGGGGYGQMGMGGPMAGGMPGMAGPNGQMMMQGTLVFPYNNLTRSPRDYFMWDGMK